MNVNNDFNGTLTLLGFNSSDENVSIDIENTFAQAVFEMLSGTAKALYSERSGNYQNQKGVTWSK